MKSLPAWIVSICGFISQVLRFRDPEYQNKTVKTVVTFDARAKLTNSGDEDDLDAFARFKVHVKTVDGVSHVEGSINVKRRIQGMFELMEIKLEHRKFIVLVHGVHNLIITGFERNSTQFSQSSASLHQNAI